MEILYTSLAKIGSPDRKINMYEVVISDKVEYNGENVAVMAGVKASPVLGGT